jgi:predicted Zn finger-like uncharacterized protein
MLLATRCPFCETVFQLRPAQLAARRGLVRCGHCQETFDASGSLFEVPENGSFADAVPVAPDVAATLTAPATATPSPEAGAPDFASPGWTPRAPQPESQVDNRLLYDAEHLPKPALAPGVTPRVVPRPAEPPPGSEPGTETGTGAAASANPAPAAAHWRQIAPDHTEPSFSSNEAPSALSFDPEPVLPRGAA